MKAEVLRSDRIKDFIEYCKKHRMEIDDSFLYDEDLKKFVPNDENPTCIITDQQGEIVGAASLIIDEYNKSGRKGRFRIFHSEIEKQECYDMMMKIILKYTSDIDSVFVFVPIVNKKLMELIKGLWFEVDRYSFLLVRDDLSVPEVRFPENYEIIPFKTGRDEEVWCEVRNSSFARLKGSETPITPKIVVNMMTSEDNIEGGSMILYHKERPVGLIRGAMDEYEGSQIMNIGPLAIIPEYQGKGLGRSLLRASLQFAKEKSYDKTILCVNAENERAKELYQQEGFKQVEAVACYKYNLKNNI